MDSNIIFTTVLGQVIRHILTGLAASLAVYGVTADQQTSLVNATVAIVVALAVALAVQVWAYVSKKAAFLTHPAAVTTENTGGGL